MTADLAPEKPHATLGASKAAMWMACPGSLALSLPFPNVSSSYADEGTAAHELAEWCLTNNQNAIAYAGRIIIVEKTGRKFEVDAEMVDGVQLYVDYVRGLGGAMQVEQEIDFSDWLEQPEAFGTSDAVVLTDEGELVVIDLKYGRKGVSAEQNPQLMLYGLGSLSIAQMVTEVSSVRLVIVQPRGDGPKISEWPVSVEDLEAFALKARTAARVAMQHVTGEVMPPKLVPGDKQCQWCLAGKNLACPALNAESRSVATRAAQIDDFADLTADNIVEGLAAAEPENVGDLMSKVDLLEQVCKSIRAEVERRLVQGVAVPGFKLVEGKRGNRAWVDAIDAEAKLKGFRLKTEEMYDLKLISPTTAGKLVKAGVIGPRQWVKLKDEITQSAGKPSVAPESDKRPAITVAASADDFEDVSLIGDLA